MEHLTTEQILERLAQAVNGEAPRFQDAATDGIEEKQTDTEPAVRADGYLELFSMICKAEEMERARGQAAQLMELRGEPEEPDDQALEPDKEAEVPLNLVLEESVEPEQPIDSDYELPLDLTLPAFNDVIQEHGEEADSD